MSAHTWPPSDPIRVELEYEIRSAFYRGWEIHIPEDRWPGQEFWLTSLDGSVFELDRLDEGLCAYCVPPSRIGACEHPQERLDLQDEAFRVSRFARDYLYHFGSAALERLADTAPHRLWAAEDAYPSSRSEQS